LQRPEDEQPAGESFDVASMTIAERERFKRRLFAKYPHLVEEYRALASDDT
jgi:hypothetical protein